MKPTLLFFLFSLSSLVFSHKQYDGFEPALLSSEGLSPNHDNYDGFPRFLQSQERTQNEAQNTNYDEITNKLEIQAENIVKMRNEAEKKNAKFQKKIDILQSFLLKAKIFCGETLKSCEIGTDGRNKEAVNLSEFFSQ